jgi:hypothetical protein
MHKYLNPGRKSLKPLMAVALALGAIATSTAWADEVLKNRLLKEGPAGWAKLENLSRGLVASGTQTVEVPAMGEQVASTSKVRWSFGSKGGLVRTVRVRPGESGSVKQAFVAGPRFNFTLQAETPQNPGVVDPDAAADWHVPFMGPDRQPIDFVVKEGVGRYIRAPFTLMGMSLPDLVDDPAFAIEAVDAVQHQGSELVRLTFKYNNPTKLDGRPTITEHLSGTAMTGGKVLLDPMRCWAIKTASLTTNTGGRPIIVIDYGDEINGVPSLKRVVERWVTADAPDDTELAQITKFEFDEFTPGGLSDDDFTLAAFGVNTNTASGESRPRSTSRLFTICAGAVLGVLAIVLSVVAHRKSRNQK